MKAHIIIPARHDSDRLPGKPLRKIDGVPLIVRAIQTALKVPDIASLTVAADHPAILDIAERHCDVLLTPETIRTGTDRCAHAAKALSIPMNDLVINVQGDMYDYDPRIITDLIQYAKEHPVSTVAKASFSYSSGVFIVTDVADKALYFSRFPARNEGGYRPVHMGVYAYRNTELQSFHVLPRPAVELAEDLEQLRWLYYGNSMYVMRTEYDIGRSINTEEDLKGCNIETEDLRKEVIAERSGACGEIVTEKDIEEGIKAKRRRFLGIPS